MSKFNKSTVAFAVAAALSLPVTAMAATAGYPANTNSTFASNIFGVAANTISNPAAFSINAVASDNFIGRTTGFGVRLTLGNGVLFANTTVAPTQGAGLTDYLAPTLAAAIPAGGSASAVFSVTPDVNGSPNITTGAILTWVAGDIVLRNLGALASPGATVPVTIELFDSNTATVFSTISATLATSAEGTSVVFDTLQGDVQKRIDVANCVGTPTVGPKRRFSPTGVVGASCTAADTDRLEFNAGAILLGITQVGTLGPVRAAGFAGNNSVAGAFVYDPLVDEVTVTVTGANFAAFNAASGNDRIYLSATANCDIGGAIPAAANTRIINAGNNSVTFALVANDFGGATGGTRFVCFATTTAVASQIAAQGLNASVAINFADNNVIDPANRAGALLPLQFNGTVLEFQNVNPAANAAAQSFLRFTNTGTIDCPVTLSGRDDNGAAGASAITFNLPVGRSLTANSEDLESGNAAKGLTGAFGDGAGRWYVTADGECAGLVGSALNRNTTDGTVTNLTPDKR